MPIIDRVMVRLMVDVEALRAHLHRLDADGNICTTALQGEYGLSPLTIIVYGPFHAGSEQIPEHLLLLGDSLHLLAMATEIRKNPSPFWVEELAAERPPFEPGDRDDVLAARLYQLVKALEEDPGSAGPLNDPPGQN